MSNWKKLQDLNLKEVSIKTQIEMKFLEAFVEKDFETLKRFNVRGFIKILMREYELEFDDFLEEYENYLSENKIEVVAKNKDNTITPKLDSYKAQKKISFLPVLVIAFVLALGGAGVYYFDELKEIFDKKEKNISANSVVNIVTQAELNLKNLESTTQNNDENSSSEEEETLKEDEKENKEESTEISTLSSSSTELNSSKEENLSEQNSENTQDLLQNTQNSEENLSQKQAEFKSNMKIWVGLIDLATFRKTTSIEEGDFNVSLDKDTLVLTGAAALDLINEEGKEENFPAGVSKRFLIKDGKIKSITLGEFMRLNKGREW